MDAELVTPALSFLGSLLGTASAIGIYGLKRRAERAAAWKQQRDTFRLYVAPLRVAVDSLRHRLDELFQPGRSEFLKTDSPDTEYNTYKFRSTLYRIAAVLGWVQAYRRERAFIDPSRHPAADPVEQQVQRLQAAFADGSHVEQRRLDELRDLLIGPDVPNRHQMGDLADAAVEVENTRWSHLVQSSVLSPTDLEEAAATKLVEPVAEILSRTYSTEIPARVLSNRSARSINLLGIREAYLYRDWQAPIGDMMIVDVSQGDGTRRFDVVGFRTFDS